MNPSTEHFPVCPGCDEVKKLNAFGCCNSCRRRVLDTLYRIETDERIADMEPPAQYHKAEQRFVDQIETFTTYLSQIKRRRQGLKWVKPEGSWIAYDERTCMRIIAGAQADLDALRAGLAQYRELWEAA